MNVLDWPVTLQNIDFRFEPRALPPDFKSLLGKVLMEKNVIKKYQCMRKICADF